MKTTPEDNSSVAVKITQQCITCGESGHTYIDCPRAPFAEIFAGAFGLTDLSGRRREVAKNLDQLSRPKRTPQPNE